MSERWDIGSETFAELEVKSIHGNSGLAFYRLIFQVDITQHSRSKEARVMVNTIKGELWVKGKNNKEYFLGCAQRPGPDNPIETYDYTFTSNIQLEMELDSRRMEAIEQIRLGEDLSFRLELYGIARSRQTPFQPVNATLQYRANQSTWIEVLGQMGYRQTLLLEIPVLSEEISPSFAESSEHLKKAQTMLLNGHFRESVGACRDVLESLAKALGDEAETNSIPFENLRELDKEKRFRQVRRALRFFTHPARHADEVSAQIEWELEDAKAIISLTAVILQLAVKGK